MHVHSARQIVHIIGSGHSGSTLLDMVLGGHSQVSSLGEAYFLYFNLRNFREKDVCTCGKHVTQCAFWARVEEEAIGLLKTDARPALTALSLADERIGVLRDERGEFRQAGPDESYPFRSRVNEAVLVAGSRMVQRMMSGLSRDVARHRRIARDMVTLYELVRRAHGTPIVLDSTKNPGAFKNIYLQADVPMRFILMIRDGRAVCHSRMRREGVTMAQAARIWKSEHLKRAVAQFTVPGNRVLEVRYEDLATRPEETVRGICAFLGVDYEPRMLEFRDDRHNLGGNPMRFRQGETRIELDEAWRRDLGAGDILAFDRVAGRLNRRLGYE
jgi:hypothetical protein